MIGAEKFRAWMPHPGYNKKDSTPPDYTPMANASKESAQIMGKLGQDQLDFAKQQYADMAPTYKQIVDADMATQAQTQRQGQEYYDYMQNTFRPVEKSLVDESMQSPDAVMGEYAGRAKADMTASFANQRAQGIRQMAAMGVNPNSGRFDATTRAAGLQEAAATAGAVTAGRNQGKALGYAKRMDAAGLGRGLPGASTGAYGVAVNAGNSAGSNTSAPGLAYSQMATPGINAVGTGLGQQIQGLGSMLNSQTNVYNQSQNAQGELGGAVLGTAGRIGAALPWGTILSDRRLKRDIRKIGETRDGLNLYEFEYKWGGGRQVGVMADEVEKVMPEAVMTGADGFKRVNYSMLGV